MLVHIFALLKRVAICRQWINTPHVQTGHLDHLTASSQYYTLALSPLIEIRTSVSVETAAHMRAKHVFRM